MTAVASIRHLLLLLFISCSTPEDGVLRKEVIVSNEVFTVSYNEAYEQPNWVRYTVSNRQKNVDRGSMDFYKENNIHTSDDNDYYKNVWDKGHLAPAASFSDTYENLHHTFSYLNCTLQYDKLNRYEWAQLESQVREWSKEYGDIKVMVTIEFNEGHTVLPTGAHVPSGFTKSITFPNNTTECYYFTNEEPEFNWDYYEIDCN